MTRQFIIPGEITFAQLVKIYSLGSPSVFRISLARLVLTIFVMVLSSMEINVNTINQPRVRIPTCARVYLCVSCKQAPPYALSRQAIEHQKYREAAFNPVPDVDLYLSAYIIVEIHVLTLLWERRVKEDFTVAPAIHRCNTRRHPLPTRRDIRIFREETHGGQIFTTFFGVDQLCKLIPNSNVETLKRVGSRRV